MTLLVAFRAQAKGPNLADIIASVVLALELSG